MFGSTHTSRRLAGLAVVAGAFAALVPVAQADSGFQGPPDAIDRAVATRQAELGSNFNGSPDAVDRAVATRRSEEAAAFDAREHAQLALTSPAPDVIERVALAQQQHTMPEAGRTTVSALVQSPAQATHSNGFEWSDFGIGAGAGIGLMLLLLGLGVGAGTTRHGERQVSSV